MSAFDHLRSLRTSADKKTLRQYSSPTMTPLSAGDPRVMHMVTDRTVQPEGASGIPAAARIVRKTTVGIPAAEPTVTRRAPGVITGK